MIETKSLIDKFLKSVKKERLDIAVVGDPLIDEYYEIAVTRLSPEIPTSIFRSSSDKPNLTQPGGAALAAWSASCLNANTTLFCCMDDYAHEQLQSFGFNIERENHHHRTPIKRRFYDKDFPLPRWDVEEHNNFGDENWELARQRLLDRIDRHIEKVDLDVVILSDYGKGLFYGDFSQQIIDMCRNVSIPTIIDPKQEPLSQWHGCTIFKPNLKEASGFIGEDHDKLTERLDCEAVVITSGADGAFIHQPNQHSYHYRPEKTIVGHPLGYGGCGDQFISTLSVAYAHNFNIRESSIIACNAASVYATRKYNQPTMPYELRKHINPIGTKVFEDAEELRKVLNDIKSDTVLTNGCFDLLGTHHLETLKFAKNITDKLIVAVNSDESVRRLKGENRPIVPLSQRMEILASLEFVDFVIPFSEDTPLDLIQKLEPTYVVKGADYKKSDVVCGDSKVILAPLIEGHSTSSIITKIKES